MHQTLLFIQLAIAAADKPTAKWTFLTNADFERGKSLPQVQPVDHSSLYSEDLPEGDILGRIPEADISINDEANGREKRTVVTGYPIDYSWPNGRVPYRMSEDFSLDERAHIAQAMLVFNSTACVDFVPKRASDSSYVTIEKGTFCSSYVGRTGSEQFLRLGPGCFYKGIILHEMMHTLGFIHEQCRPDRDEYVRIYEENVKDKFKNNFRKYEEEEVKMIGEYDYGSVMHYGAFDFGKPFTGLQWFSLGIYYTNKMTSEPRVPGVEIGQRIGLSEGDKKKLRQVYPCTGDGKTTPLPDPDCHNNLHDECEVLGEGPCNTTMAAMCEKSCGLCGACRDKSDECKDVVKFGLCDMQMAADYCAKTCVHCPGVLEECHDDENGGCDNAVINDVCKSREGRNRCPRSCGLCQGCQDTAQGCIDKVAKDAKCADPVTRDGCQKSCKVCEDCKDVKPTACHGTVAVNLCSLPSAKENCPRTCGYCGKSSKDHCMEAYVNEDGNPDEACCEKRVRDKCPDMCRDIPPGLPMSAMLKIVNGKLGTAK